MREYVVVLLTAGLVTFLATPVVRVAAVRLRVMAAVRERDVHVIPTPRGGGVAMYLGVAAGVLVASELPSLFLPVADIGTLSLGPDVGVPVTILLTVFTVNALNFIDGLDGLAAGVSAIAALAFFAYSYNLALVGYDDVASAPALITAVLAGACLGFLPHNFSPARIFMGDSGSMLVGLMLSAAAVSATGQADAQTFPSAAARRSRRTRCTCTTGCWRSATRTAGPCSSCTSGRHC